MDLASLLTGCGMVIGGTFWLARLEGRTKSNKRELHIVADNHARQFKELREDLRYIRARIDRALAGGVR